jgi:hypothetical protein
MHAHHHKMTKYDSGSVYKGFERFPVSLILQNIWILPTSAEKLCKKKFFPLYFFTIYLKIFCIISVFLLLGSKMNKQMGTDRNN